MWSTQGITHFSPVFLLYMAELMRSSNTMARFSYADDTSILGIGHTRGN